MVLLVGAWPVLLGWAVADWCVQGYWALWAFGQGGAVAAEWHCWPYLPFPQTPPWGTGVDVS